MLLTLFNVYSLSLTIVNIPRGYSNFTKQMLNSTLWFFFSFRWSAMVGGYVEQRVKLKKNSPRRPKDKSCHSLLTKVVFICSIALPWGRGTQVFLVMNIANNVTDEHSVQPRDYSLYCLVITSFSFWEVFFICNYTAQTIAHLIFVWFAMCSFSGSFTDFTYLKLEPNFTNESKLKLKQ